jgi:hypothetical protein
MNELTVFVATYLAARGTGVIDEALKPVGQELGVHVRRLVGHFKTSNLTEVFAKARAMMPAQAEPGVDVQPGRILRLLESASLEEDDGLQTRWAALLANTVIAKDPLRVLPSFTGILAQLLPEHVKVLDAMHDAYVQDPAGRMAQREDLMKVSGLSRDDYTLLVEDLDRLKLVEHGYEVMAPEGGGSNLAATHKMLRLTSFGLTFVVACTPPRS